MNNVPDTVKSNVPDAVEINDLLPHDTNDADELNDVDVLTFEMTTPREGEDYSNWCLMAAAAAAAVQGRMELLENEDGLIFQDFLNGRKLTPRHSLGLFYCGAGLNADGESTDIESSIQTLSHQALGARLILSPKCLDLADILSKPTSDSFDDLWDLLLPRNFKSTRHAHFALWLLTEVAQRETQGAEIIRLFKNDPSLNTDDVLVNGFSCHMFDKRSAYKYMFDWLVDYPSAHNLIMLTLALERKDMENVLDDTLENELVEEVEGKDGSQDDSSKEDYEGMNKDEKEDDNRPHINGEALVNYLFDCHDLGRAHILSAITNVFEMCSDLPTYCLGSKLCLDMFDKHGSLLVERSCYEMSDRLELLKDDCKNSEKNRNSRKRQRKTNVLGEFEGATLLITLLKQLDGGCIAEKHSLNDSIDSDHCGQECISCMSPIIKTLCCAKYINILCEYLMHKDLPTSSKIQTIDIITCLLKLECETVDFAIVKYGLIQGIEKIIITETSSPILLARISKMLMTCILDKHPETGELLSYRRSKTSRYNGTIRSTILKALPTDVIHAIKYYENKMNGTTSTISSTINNKENRKEQDIMHRMIIHLTRICNILQVVERQEKKLNNSILSESKMELHAMSKEKQHDVPEDNLFLNNRTWKDFKNNLKDMNYNAFGRDCGSWVSNDDVNDDDCYDDNYDDDYGDGKDNDDPSSPSSKSPKRKFSPESPGSPPGLFDSRSSILPSTPAQTLVAHDVVEYVMAASMASLGRIVKEKKKEEDSKLNTEAPISKMAATEMHADRMARANKRFGYKIEEESDEQVVNSVGRHGNRSNNTNNDETHQENHQIEVEEGKEEEGVEEQNSIESKTSLVGGLVGRLVLPSTFDDDSDNSDDDDIVNIESKSNLLSVDDDELIVRKRK
jgi:hypothetical protein